MVQVGSAQNHIDEKQMDIEVLLYALLHLALQEALHEGCIYLEKQLLFLNPTGILIGTELAEVLNAVVTKAQG